MKSNGYGIRSSVARVRRVWCALGVGAVVMGMVAYGVAQEAGKTKAARPTGVVAQTGCVTAECHANVKSYKVVHGPVNVNACDACHKLTDEKGHKFTDVRKGADECTFCHKLEMPAGAMIHKPVTEGQCLQCHDPHGGQTNRLLRGKTMNDLCVTCHKDVMAGKKMVHGPVAAGACASCHPAHSSPFPKLLLAQGRELCLGCHTEMKTQMAKVKFTHKAVEQDCTKCHDAHASNFPMQTKEPPLQLCTSCHEHDKVKQAAMDAKYKHSIVTKDDACLNCHTAHGGDLAKLMRTEPIKVCMKCHEKKIDAGGGRMVAAVTDVLDPKQVKHGPIRDGNCGGCHNVHGSEISRLLAKPYPEAFYQAFAIEKYDMCFSCHDKQLVLTEQTSGLTNFRNGERNLHFLHVNRTEKGRSCRACHSTHASPQPLHVRETVPYGNWQLPINFTKTATGGSCSPGCHKAFDYDRVKAVVPSSPITAPTTMPTTMPVSLDLKDNKP